MKNNRGITLTSLIIYILGMIIVIGIIATFTSFFYKNMNIENINKNTTQYTKFSSIFIQEINKQGNYIVDYKKLEDNSSYIIFASGNQYTFMQENKSIYINNIKICKDIETCSFDVSYVDSKYIIEITFKTENMNFTGENALKYSM